MRATLKINGQVLHVDTTQIIEVKIESATPTQIFKFEMNDKDYSLRVTGENKLQLT